MIGYDISEFQGIGVGLGGDFVIIRAGNGRRRDFNAGGHIGAAKGRGLRWSLYLYCEPGNNSPEYQADLMCGVARDFGMPQGRKMYADIEEGGGDLRWYRDRFSSRVSFNGYVAVTRVYSGESFGQVHGVFTGVDDWVANYGPNNGRMNTPPRIAWAIWQYTSIPIDTNTASAESIARIFDGVPSAPLRPPFVEDMLLYG